MNAMRGRILGYGLAAVSVFICLEVMRLILCKPPPYPHEFFSGKSVSKLFYVQDGTRLLCTSLKRLCNGKFSVRCTRSRLTVTFT